MVQSSSSGVVDQAKLEVAEADLAEAEAGRPDQGRQDSWLLPLPATIASACLDWLKRLGSMSC